MTPSESTNIFVSYSHADASLVAPVINLLRVNKSLALQDIDDIQSGRRWRIDKALVESHLVVVFWCDHANRSNEVSKKWKAAIELQKDLLPLLLDATLLCCQSWVSFSGSTFAERSAQTTARSIRRITLLRQVRHRRGKTLEKTRLNRWRLSVSFCDLDLAALAVFANDLERSVFRFPFHYRKTTID
jgi:hypothetical protein